MIYLDNHATTKCDPRVLSKMLPFFEEDYGNASSSHAAGVTAHNAVSVARRQVAGLIGSHSDEIVFTSGATESVNLALKAFTRPGSHVISVITEHRAVLDSLEYLAGNEVEVTLLPVAGDGLLSPDDVRRRLKPNTTLVSVMYANNEIGVLQPIAEIGLMCRNAGVTFHTDASQALGKVPVNVESDAIDLLSGTAHKIYGPKGVGFLFVRRRAPGRANTKAQMHGGGHEAGLRSGTLNVPGIVGLGLACSIAQRQMIEDGLCAQELRLRLLNNLRAGIPDIILNGSEAKRLPGNLNLTIPGIDAQALLEFLPNLCLSVGSACSSLRIEPSHVLRALGLSESDAYSSIRIGIGRFNSTSEVESASDWIIDAVQDLKTII